jgi:hypothetical protein
VQVIRDYAESDKDALAKIHEASNFDYRLPLLSDPLFIVKKVVDEDGVRQGIAVKIEGTVYLWSDSSWGTPRDRWLRLQELVEAAKRAAWENGLDTLTCVVPPEIAKRFARKLRRIGMTQDRNWPKFSFDLNGYVPQ